ncbi:MAG: cation:proton antiporter [Xanthobacteraceae bacterium]|nr:cation:proton antiporter [Xanthobacteraceae bacterium]
MSAFDVGSLILLLATAVAIINERYLHLPSVIAQLLGSLLLSLAILLVSHLTDNLHFAALFEKRLHGAHLPGVFLDGVLALLLFAASLQADLRELRSNAASVFCLATIGVVLSTAFFTLSFWGILSICGMAIPIAWCFLLGAILAPTDAVAVQGLLKHSPLPGKLKTVIVGESLFNDGTAIVLFLTALAAIGGQHDILGHGRVLYAMLVEGGGGIALGLAAGFLASTIIAITKDDEIAVLATLAFALGTYRLASGIGLSGPLAVVCCGIVVSTRLARDAGERRRLDQISTFWFLVDNLLNILLFILLGFEIFTLNATPIALVSAAVAIPLVLASRFLSVALPFGIFRLGKVGDRRTPYLLTWLGLRGAISVALVQSIPNGPYNDALIAASYVVVIFTVVVQGLSTPRIIRALYPSAHNAAGDASGARGEA